RGAAARSRRHHPVPCGFPPACIAGPRQSRSRAEMQWISQVLQLAVVVQRRRPRVREREPLQELDLLETGGGAEGAVLEEFLQPSLRSGGLCGAALDEFEP